MSYGTYRQHSPSHPPQFLSFEEHYQLHGLGFLHIPEQPTLSREQTLISLEGWFREHRLSGEGLKTLHRAGKLVYGQFSGGELSNMDTIASCYAGQSTEGVDRLLRGRKRALHLHAIRFLNNYANERPTLILQNLLKAVHPQ